MKILKIKKMLSIMMVSVFLFSFNFHSNITSQAQNIVHKERYIVSFTKDSKAHSVKESIKKDKAIETFFELKPQNALVVNMTENAKNKLQKMPGVLRVVKDPIASIDAKITGAKPTPTPPPQSLPWGVDKIDADLIWDADQNKVLDTSANTGKNVKVAIIDTGIDIDHPDLVDNIQGGINYVRNDNNFDDDNGHGTHVAGTVGAISNAQGVIGVAPQVSLYGVKVLDRNGSGSYSNIIRGINWAIANGMNVINMSLGGTTDLPELRDAVAAANAAGIVVVCAAGNNGSSGNATNYPGAYSEVIGVASVALNSTTNQITRSSFSNYGSYVDIAAPGSNVYSTYRGGVYKTLSGTSMASPHIAGTVALMMAGGITGTETIKNKLYSTATDLGTTGWDEYYGHGFVNAYQAVK